MTEYIINTLVFLLLIVLLSLISLLLIISNSIMSLSYRKNTHICSYYTHKYLNVFENVFMSL